MTLVEALKKVIIIVKRKKVSTIKPQRLKDLRESLRIFMRKKRRWVCHKLSSANKKQWRIRRFPTIQLSFQLQYLISQLQRTMDVATFQGFDIPILRIKNC